jgi:hypothetical protein
LVAWGASHYSVGDLDFSSYFLSNKFLAVFLNGLYFAAPCAASILLRQVSK